MRIRTQFFKDKETNIKEMNMEGMITIEVKNLTDAAFHTARNEMLKQNYMKLVEAEPETSRTRLMEKMAIDMGLNTKTVRMALSEMGMETALPNFAVCGRRAKSAMSV